MTHYRNIHSCRSNKTTTTLSLDWPFLRRSYKMFRIDHLSTERSADSDNKTEQLEIRFSGSWKPWLTWLHFMPSAWLAATSWRAPLACIKRLLTRTVHLILHRLETFCGAEKVKTHRENVWKGTKALLLRQTLLALLGTNLVRDTITKCPWLDTLGPWEGEGESCTTILPTQPLSIHFLFLICFIAND